MSFYKASKSADDVKQGGSDYITGSGIYPVTVLAAIASTSKGGSESVDLYVDSNGQKQIVYGNLRITNNDKSPNKIGSKIFNQLVIIADLDDVADPVETQLPIGKGEKMETVAVLEDIDDVDVFMRIQMEYDIYPKGSGNITEKKIIKSFFRADDKATAEEIVHGSEVGVGFEREQKYVNSVTYKEGLTEEKVTAWIASGRKKGSGATGAEGKPQPNFGEKRTFGKDKV